MQTRLGSKPKVKYSYGVYNKYNDEEQHIRITEGCPHNCPFCNEPQEIKIFKIPNIVRNEVKIKDMNLLCKKEALKIIKNLGKQKAYSKVVYYELECGIDYRFLTQEIADALKKSRFKNIRFAWDWHIDDQYKIKDAVLKLLKAGYKTRELSCFMIVNWKIPLWECELKMDLLKVWNIKINDCCYNGGYKVAVPQFWTQKEMKYFRHKSGIHNNAVNFKIYPVLKRAKRIRLK